FFVIGNCDAISYYKKTLREDAQTAEMELIAAQYRGRARVLQAKLFVLNSVNTGYNIIKSLTMGDLQKCM
ncbi:MAG: hypothetical protein IIT46_02925, partial [Lachnospiraceae bacterium]|nr:hypothetical protein [Lachnospiraceae bacterium]